MKRIIELSVKVTDDREDPTIGSASAQVCVDTTYNVGIYREIEFDTDKALPPLLAQLFYRAEELYRDHYPEPGMEEED